MGEPWDRMSKVWFVTGCSTGFGKVLCQELLHGDDLVVATARKVGDIEDLAGPNSLTLSLDVTDAAQCQIAVNAALEQFGRIDVLVNNAGYGLIGAVEEVSDTEVRHMFDVNLFGVMNVLRAALPSMRSRRSGHVLNISSTAGLLAFPGSATYASTKHALEGLSEGLSYELEPLGIHVTLIEPGPFRTDFAGRSIAFAERKIEDYAETAGKRRKSIRDYNGKQTGDPLKAVQAMIKVTEMEKPPLRLPLGNSAYDWFREKLEFLKREVDEGEALGRPTDYPI
jgi:NAD(P)-dependent dehydrogenase (short-subunit alcohol dehydrogenase family)